MFFFLSSYDSFNVVFDTMLMRGEMMKKQNTMTEVQVRQSYNHANIVYLSTVIASFFLIPLFIYIGNLTLIFVTITAPIASLAALKLNQMKRYGLASLIFITFITLETIVEVIYFDMKAGFVYYFFNMASLIIYTNWTNKQKIIGVTLEISLFILTFIYSFYFNEVIVLSPALLLTFHVANILLNMIGVTNSAFYYVNIADRAQIRLAKLAMIDYLTDLPNRQAIAYYFDKLVLDNEWFSQDYAVIMIDIDHFKDINDTYGHLVGDTILKEIGSILNRQKRDIDFLGRYGGEEFVMAVKTDTLFKLSEILENYRSKIEMSEFQVNNLSLKLTISIGAFFKPKELGITYQDAIESADSLLYLAKQEGRNRVIINLK